jgi:hypothetical protein
MLNFQSILIILNKYHYDMYDICYTYLFSLSMAAFHYLD